MILLGSFLLAYNFFFFIFKFWGHYKHSNDQNTDDATTKWRLQWLDLEPTRSVVYVIFNSRSTMSNSHAMELATGLEGIGKRLL